MANRTMRAATAMGRLGAGGTAVSARVEGRGLETTVVSIPMLAGRGGGGGRRAVAPDPGENRHPPWVGGPPGEAPRKQGGGAGREGAPRTGGEGPRVVPAEGPSPPACPNPADHGLFQGGDRPRL